MALYTLGQADASRADAVDKDVFGVGILSECVVQAFYGHAFQPHEQRGQGKDDKGAE